MRFLKRLKRGFTLVELVIVIAVIAVLAAVLVPVFGNVIRDAKISRLKADLNTCSNALIMFAQYNDIDYYTPANVKDFLKSEGIDTDAPVMDGYSIWYDQRNFNLSLVKNTELGDFVRGSALSANAAKASRSGATVAFAETIGGNDAVLSTLPRRLEAITENEDLLLIATDEENLSLLNGFSELYNFGDSDRSLANYLFKDYDYIVDRLWQILHAMEGSELCKVSDFADYCNSFTLSGEGGRFSVAWLNDEGNWIVCAPKTQTPSVYRIDKTIVSPNLGRAASGGNDASVTMLQGAVYANGRLDEGARLDITCTTEITSSEFDVKIDDGFYDKIVNSGANIVVSGKVELSTNAESVGAVSVSSVSTASGIAGRISVAVSNGTGTITSDESGRRYVSGTMNTDEFAAWINSGKVTVSPVTASNSVDPDKPQKIAVTEPSGKVVYVDGGESFFDDARYTVTGGDQAERTTTYKYNMPEFSLDVSALMADEGVTDESQIGQLNIVQTTYYGVTGTSVFMRYTKDGTVYGKNYYLGIGYISSFDHYYSYFDEADENYSGGYKTHNLTKTYNRINSVGTSVTAGENTAASGAIGIKLPASALNLQNYKSGNFYIEVYYKPKTVYYREEVSDFNTKVKVKSHAVRADEERKLTMSASPREGATLWNKDGDIYFAYFGIQDMLVGESGIRDAVYFVNTVEISRILIRDAEGTITIAKYPEKETDGVAVESESRYPA